MNMNSIRKSVLCAVLALAGAVSADILYWQIDPSSAGDRGYTGTAKYAALYATTSDGKGDKASATTTKVAGYYDLEESKAFQTDLGAYGTSEYNFFVELLNASGDSWTQYTTSYDDLVSSGYVSTSPLSVPTAALTGGFNGAAVPEPTGGMLLLIGGALLALRRRRQA